MWMVLAACQEPFRDDRHDLTGFRIAAVTAPSVEGFVEPRAAVVVDGRAWASEPAALAWGFVEDEDAASGDFEVDGTGAAPLLPLPPGRRTLVVTATHGGVELRAFLTVPPDPIDPPAGFDIGPLPLPAAPEGPELVREARAALEPEGAGRTVDGRGWLRISAGVPDGTLVRYMATAGSFLELDAATADWTATTDLHLDEDELDRAGATVPDGTVTVLALALADPGQTAFTATEVFVGGTPAGVWVGSRFVPVTGFPALPEQRAVLATFREDPTAPSGFRLEDGELVDETTLATYGTELLACVPAVVGPLEPDWFLTQRCTPRGSDGLPVVVRATDLPPTAGGR